MQPSRLLAYGRTLPALDSTGGYQWQDLSVQLPVRGQLQHFRIYLPPQALPADIAAIELAEQSSGKPLRVWNFARRPVTR